MGELSETVRCVSRRLRSIFFVGLLLPSVVMGKVEPTCDANDSTCQEHSQCAVYMAPSTIPNAGLGIFTAKDLQPETVIAIGDVMFPIVDLEWNHVDRRFFDPFADYVWAGSVMGMQLESSDHEGVTAFAPGLDAAINCHLGLLNVDRGDPVYDNGGLHRSRHPGAGAITPYHNGTTIVKSFIPSGGELFKFYGDEWFSTRLETFGLIPLSRDYHRAETLLKRFDAYIEQNGYDEEVKQGLWELMKDFGWESRVLNAVPESREDLSAVVDGGVKAVLQPYHVYSVEHLETHGRCLDNIRVDSSTIHGAGRGAFATRPIAKGQVITGSPLVHIPHESLLKLHPTKLDEELQVLVPDYDTKTPRYQIITNYCWSHPESTLLLCPYGSGVNYINHDSKRVNVKVAWPEDGDFGHNAAWLDKDPSQMEYVSPKLSLDYVAARDIEEGEELFLDYGKQWEQAWSLHASNWIPEDSSYKDAQDFNRDHEDSILLTTEEQEEYPYPSNLAIRCHPSLLSTTLDDRSTHFYDWHIAEKGVACEIKQSVLEDYEDRKHVAYRVNIYDGSFGGFRELEHVPRQAISFVDLPYTTDIHMQSAFRQPMIFPDELFPQAWRNKRVET